MLRPSSSPQDVWRTRGIESGVDIPTVAKWLGHKDGGVLAMQNYGHLRDRHSADMAQKLVVAEASLASALANVVVLPNASGGNAIAEKESPATVAKTKAKYSYPWWASENPAEVFWGQVNEAVQIVPMEKYIAAAAQAMGREVFKTELSDPQALIAEFQERVDQPILKALSTKIPSRKAEDPLAKAG